MTSAGDHAARLASRVALHAVDWAAGKAARAIEKKVSERVTAAAKAKVVGRLRPRRSVPPVVLPQPRKLVDLSRPFLGTKLTLGGAAITFAAGPAAWFVVDLAWAALPA